ncbi:GDP-L-fucose synthase family protein [Desulfosudis oleivorans]|uniref:GDP-L-fucose synthase n=1 Tax=Desulfosudis oleivorans (strain DSM 6200 / JCM 39069 / Hxd3) TaxID=96561 RepID=A8ZY81_DESOH|nr:GDP-L-fucose synthase [Desulfosudis oleivorans]ABW67088.1 NAD-dependent epimerase/dehydratase [Desulfosudis oleivorans Hxd3]
MEKDAVIYIAGHRGLAGSALVRQLEAQGYTDLLTRTHAELDLTCQADTESFFQAHRPAYVFMAAAKVGGILANNTFPAEFIYQNLAIQTNIIHAAYRAGVRRLLFLGSSCIYPRECPQPMKEGHLLTGPLEPTNEPYAVAKIAGIKMCQSYNRQYNTRFVAVMPTNLYGPNDNFDLETSHVLPALIRKFHEAKKSGAKDVVVWGTGKPRREFLHVDDLAHAGLFIMNLPDADFDRLAGGSGAPLINIGTGKDISIAELAGLIKEITGFEGDIRFDATKPDGTFQKLLDVSRMTALGWQAKTDLRTGIQSTYQWCLDHHVF